jgi:hypothetical protein
MAYNGKNKSIIEHKNEEYCARMRDIYILENFPNQDYKMNYFWDGVKDKQNCVETWKSIIYYKI